MAAFTAKNSMFGYGVRQVDREQPPCGA